MLKGLHGGSRMGQVKNKLSFKFEVQQMPNNKLQPTHKATRLLWQSLRSILPQKALHFVGG